MQLIKSAKSFSGNQTQEWQSVGGQWTLREVAVVEQEIKLSAQFLH